MLAVDGGDFGAGCACKAAKKKRNICLRGNITMITRYRIGEPIDTEAILQKPEIHPGFDPAWTVIENEKTLVLRMDPDAVVYGLGETVRGINKRGWLYTSDNKDENYHDEGKHSLYASHNFFLVSSKRDTFGMFVDTPVIVSFDIGFTKRDIFSIRFDYFDADFYVLRGGSQKEIVREFRGLIGRSYIPPKCAFGYGQSRYSYMTAEEVRNVAEGYNRAGIPLDMIYLDIDYMERFKDFTTNEETFPDFPGFVNEMKEQGIHLIPIIDAGVKIEDGYDIYEEGKAGNYFVKKENGDDMTAAVWPGKVHLPDFLNDGAREWFGNKYDFLLSKGIDGFWNDMNEPAIFYTEEYLKEVFEKIEDFRGKELDVYSFFDFVGLVSAIENNPEYFTYFYHNYHGNKIRHDKVHNLYGYFMTRAAGEAFRRLSPDKRIFMFSRASYIGMHRYGGIWTGDNHSWWSHLLLNIQQLPGLNMCGFLYCGADMGGYSDDCTEDLLLRWAQVSLFTPLMRNHSRKGTRRQELYLWENSQDFRHVIELRYALLPYIYSEFMKAALRDEMYIEPLSFEYEEDARAREVDDQLLVGESIMIAPVYKQNASGRYVYLPETMKLIRFRSAEDYDEEELPAGDHYVSVKLNETAVFLRRGHVLPLIAPALRTAGLDHSTLHYICYDAEAESYELYDDDGISISS